MIPIEWFMALSAALFCLGIFCVLARRSAIAILMGIELMLNACNINLATIARYTDPKLLSGQVFVVFVMTIAAAEAAVGLAIMISVYRNIRHISVDKMNILKW